MARIQACPALVEEEVFPVLAPNYLGGGSNEFRLALSQQQAGRGETLKAQNNYFGVALLAAPTRSAPRCRSSRLFLMSPCWQLQLISPRAVAAGGELRHPVAGAALSSC